MKYADWILYLGTGGIATYILSTGIASMFGFSYESPLPLIPEQQNAIWYVLIGIAIYAMLYIHWKMMRGMKH